VAPVTGAWSAIPDPGSSRLREPEVQHLDRAVRSHFDVRGLQVAMDDALFVRRFDRLGYLLRQRQRFVHRHRAGREAVRQRRSVDELHDERMRVTRIFESVNLCDVRMVERGQHVRFAFEACEAVRVLRDGGEDDLQRDVSIQLGVARYTSPIPPKPIRSITSYVPIRVPGVIGAV
jgi:hypothetical protein